MKNLKLLRIVFLLFVILSIYSHPVLSVDFETAIIEGSVSFDGAQLSGLGTNKMLVYIPNIGSTYLNSNGTFTFLNLPTGTHTISLYGNGCSQSHLKLGEITVSVVAGDIQQANIDITATAGQVVGTITVNGTPVEYPDINVDGHCGESPVTIDQFLT